MKRPAVLEAFVFAALLALGVGLRVWFQHLPNFAPVAAIALFAGYFFRSWLVAACLPLLIMGGSDYFIGGYDAQMMAMVHATLALPVLFRNSIRRWSDRSESRGFGYCVSILGSSLAASCLFFLVTNFGSWLWFDMYDRTPSGLAWCYWRALPFFRYTLTGDLFFAVVLFGGHALLKQLRPANEVEIESALQPGHTR